MFGWQMVLMISPSFRAFTLSHSASTSMLSLITSRVTEYFLALPSGHRRRRDDSHEWSTACVYLSCSSSSVCVVSTQRPWWHLVKRSSFFSFVRPCCFLPFSIFALDSSHTAPNKLQKNKRKIVLTHTKRPTMIRRNLSSHYGNEIWGNREGKRTLCDVFEQAIIRWETLVLTFGHEKEANSMARSE